MASKYEGTPARRFLFIFLGAPLLAFGLIILLGAFARLVTDSFTLPTSSYLAAIVFGGLLPVAIGLLLIIQGLKKRT
ncbi:MAG: hypothetical protein Q7K29_01355 [Thermoleophilia bacterium]|nr:hypothetical protein [Thermoleophilia bacterium]